MKKLFALALTAALLSLFACGAAPLEQAVDWQTAYTAVLSPDEGVSGAFFLLDADGNGTPELYRLINLRGNGVTQYDAALHPGSVVEHNFPYLDYMEATVPYYDKAGKTIGMVHEDGGPADERGMPRTESYGEYRYANGAMQRLALMRHDWLTDENDNIVAQSYWDFMTDKATTREAYEGYMQAFKQKYTQAVPVFNFQDNPDLDKCWKP